MKNSFFFTNLFTTNFIKSKPENELGQCGHDLLNEEAN